MNVIKDIWTKSFIHNTYSCIEGRGIHLCANNLKRDLRKYPVDSRGINFVGYVFYHTHTLIRKSIKYDWRIYAKNRKEKVKLKT